MDYSVQMRSSKKDKQNYLVQYSNINKNITTIYDCPPSNNYWVILCYELSRPKTESILTQTYDYVLNSPFKKVEKIEDKELLYCYYRCTVRFQENNFIKYPQGPMSM